MKYHVAGKCDNKCPKKDSHVKLDNDTILSLREYVKNVRANYDSFVANKVYKEGKKKDDKE